MQYKYRNSELKCIENTPVHWAIKRLYNICSFVRGNSTFGKNELLNKGKYIALQYGKTYKVEEINKQFKFYVNDKFYKSSQVVNYGDTIFVSTSETIEDLGHSVFYNRKDIGLIGGEQILLKPNQSILDGKYLFYSSKIFGKEVKKFATGIKVFRFDIYDLKTIYIQLPPLKEQKAIVDYLDNACSNIDTTIELKEKQIIEINDYYYSSIHEVITKGLDKTTNFKNTNIECIGDIPTHWNIAKIKQKYSVIPSSVNKKSKDTEAEVQLCNYTDVYYKDYITNDIDFMVATAKDSECEKFKLNIDDVIITKDSEDPSDIAVPALVKEVQDNLLCGYHLSMIRAKIGNVSGRYLFWLLKDKAIVSQLHREATGITRWAISQRNIKNTIIPNPPLKEQIQIANYLEKTSDRVNKIKEKLQAQIDTLIEYRKSLIHECVTGKKQIYKGSEGE